MKIDFKKYLLYFISTIIVAVIILSMLWLGHFEIYRDFINKIEQTSFDLRQNITSKYKTPDKNIVIVAVDNESYEYIMDKYGEWPISRKLWADVIENIEKVNPNKIIFDLLFVKPNLNDIKADKALVDAVKKYDNVYLSMNFDYTDKEVRTPIKLDDKFKVNIKIKDKNILNNDYTLFTNVRGVMDELSKVSNKIGSININRDKDGIIRNVTPVYLYQNDFYPNLSLLVGMDYLKVKEIKYENNKLILDNNHTIPLDNTKRTILNWYGGSHTYLHIPLWKVANAIKKEDIKFLKDNFENKIIYIGTTATSLSDVKSVPVDSNLSGVELNATFLNNILDNNFIKKTNIEIDLLITILLSFFVGYFVLKIDSVLKTFVFLFLTLLTYFSISVFAMQKYNLWISIVIPYISTIATFVLVYCEKYLLKSKDYEQTYKLAVTDGLTQLYNHRYFQEQMLTQLNNYKRYKTPFSLIMIDIDFFKKFNDTYGHQSGDCVLKQVANILKRNSRTSDIACRYGGEEMSIILTNTNNKDAITTAEKICNTVRESDFILANNEKVKVTISVGVASVNDSIEKTQQLIEYCDKCLYKAKENGRNQVVFEV